MSFQAAGIDPNGYPSLLGWDPAGTATGPHENLWRIPVTSATSDLGGGTTTTYHPAIVSDIGGGGGGGGNVVQSTRAITDTDQAWYVSQVNAVGAAVTDPIKQGTRDTDAVATSNAWYVSEVNRPTSYAVNGMTGTVGADVSGTVDVGNHPTSVAVNGMTGTVGANVSGTVDVGNHPTSVAVNGMTGTIGVNASGTVGANATGTVTVNAGTIAAATGRITAGTMAAVTGRISAGTIGAATARISAGTIGAATANVTNTVDVSVANPQTSVSISGTPTVFAGTADTATFTASTAATGTPVNANSASTVRIKGIWMANGGDSDVGVYFRWADSTGVRLFPNRKLPAVGGLVNYNLVGMNITHAAGTGNDFQCVIENDPSGTVDINVFWEQG